MENWRNIPGLEGFYQASDGGKIRSCARSVRARGAGTRMVSSRILKTCLLGRYCGVILSVRGARRTGLVHRLVCAAFHGAPQPGMQAAHIDGNPSNNLPGNLRWATAKENCADRVVHGTQAQGERINTNKLSTNDVLSILERASSGEAPKNLAAEFGVHVSSIHQMVRGDTWKHLAAT